MKKGLIAAVAVLFALVSCTSKAPRERTVQYDLPSGTVKIISFNVRYSNRTDGNNIWENRKDAAMNMIEEEAPSAFGLQEALQDQLSYFENSFPQYAWVGVGRDDGKKEGECMAVFYNKEKFSLLDSGTFWLSETPDEVSMGWDAACHRTCTWVVLEEMESGKSFAYFNTHLDHIGEKAREESVKLLVSKINSIAADGCPVILGGDLNSGIESSIFGPFEEAGLLPARKICPETEFKGTFTAFGSAPSGIILDHFFVRGDITPISFKTLDKDYGAPYISDHYPIRFTFSF